MLEMLAWDSDFWGFPVGELALSSERRGRDLPDPDILNAYAVVQARLSLTENQLARDLSRLGFFPASSRVELERAARGQAGDEDRRLPDLPEPQWTDSIADAEADEYAKGFVEHSRFRAFPVDKRQVATFYREWIRRAMAGAFDDGLEHLTSDRRTAGFVSYRVRGETLVIGLLAVAAQYRGRGVASHLLSRMDETAGRQGATKLVLATEGTNITARRAYVRDGFLPASDAVWMYRVP